MVGKKKRTFIDEIPEEVNADNVSKAIEDLAKGFKEKEGKKESVKAQKTFELANTSENGVAKVIKVLKAGKQGGYAKPKRCKEHNYVAWLVKSWKTSCTHEELKGHTEEEINGFALSQHEEFVCSLCEAFNDSDTVDAKLSAAYDFLYADMRVIPPREAYTAIVTSNNLKKTKEVLLDGQYKKHEKNFKYQFTLFYLEWVSGEEAQISGDLSVIKSEKTDHLIKKIEKHPERNLLFDPGMVPLIIKYLEVQHDSKTSWEKSKSNGLIGKLKKACKTCKNNWKEEAEKKVWDEAIAKCDGFVAGRVELDKQRKPIKRSFSFRKPKKPDTTSSNSSTTTTTSRPTTTVSSSVPTTTAVSSVTSTELSSSQRLSLPIIVQSSNAATNTTLANGSIPSSEVTSSANQPSVNAPAITIPDAQRESAHSTTVTFTPSTTSVTHTTMSRPTTTTSRPTTTVSNSVPTTTSVSSVTSTVVSSLQQVLPDKPSMVEIAIQAQPETEERRLDAPPKTEGKSVSTQTEATKTQGQGTNTEDEKKDLERSQAKNVNTKPKKPKKPKKLSFLKHKKKSTTKASSAEQAGSESAIQKKCIETQTDLGSDFFDIKVLPTSDASTQINSPETQDKEVEANIKPESKSVSTVTVPTVMCDVETPTDTSSQGAETPIIHIINKKSQSNDMPKANSANRSPQSFAAIAILAVTAAQDFALYVLIAIDKIKISHEQTRYGMAGFLFLFSLMEIALMCYFIYLTCKEQKVSTTLVDTHSEVVHCQSQAFP